MRQISFLSFSSDKTNIPYVGPINHELIPGLELEFKITIPHYCRRFAINLQCGPNISPRDDVALHLSPDFDRMVVVRNNILQNSWGPEETIGPFPFIKGHNSRICIRYENECFKIRVDDNELTTFLHRIPPSKVTYIAIDGEIILNSIEVKISSASSLNASAPGYPSVPYPSNVGFTPQGYSQAPYPQNPSPYPQNPPPYPQNPPPYPQNLPPYPMAGQTPYSSGALPPYSTGPSYPGAPTAYSSGRQSPYLAGGHQSYPSNSPHPPSSPSMGYQSNHPYPQQPGVYGGNYANTQGYPSQQKSKGPLDKAGALLGGLAGGAMLGGALKHGTKKISKKKALKYGLPIAGVGLGAYALKKGFHRSSSSSSSSSSD